MLSELLSWARTGDTANEEASKQHSIVRENLNGYSHVSWLNLARAYRRQRNSTALWLVSRVTAPTGVGDAVSRPRTSQCTRELQHRHAS